MTTGATEPPKGGFVIFAYWDSMTTQRAIAYIDGYNLYYSRLRGTTYK